MKDAAMSGFVTYWTIIGLQVYGLSCHITRKAER